MSTSLSIRLVTNLAVAALSVAGLSFRPHSLYAETILESALSGKKIKEIGSIPDSSKAPAISQSKSRFMVPAASQAGASDQVTVRLFFPRDGYENPDSAARNWYYYWRQDDVVADLNQFNYDDTDTDYGHYYNGNLYVGHAAPTQNDGPIAVTHKETGQQELIGANGMGIWCCAEHACMS